MTLEEVRFQAIKEAQRFVTANKDQYIGSFRAPEGITNTVVRVADFMLAYAAGNHKEHIARIREADEA